MTLVSRNTRIDRRRHHGFPIRPKPDASADANPTSSGAYEMNTSDIRIPARRLQYCSQPLDSLLTTPRISGRGPR